MLDPQLKLDIQAGYIAMRNKTEPPQEYHPIFETVQVGKDSRVKFELINNICYLVIKSKV